MWFARINRFYDAGLWTKEMVADGVVANKITVAQYYEITIDKEYLKVLVVAGTITAEHYFEITEEVYEV